MDIGVKISGAAHAILIGIAIFGAPIFSSDEENPIQISEVSLISLEEFDGKWGAGSGPRKPSSR